MKASVLALSVVGFAFLFASEARAVAGTEEGESSTAAVRFQRAVELYREGSYEGALAEFRKAYDLSPTYRVLYNIAQSQYALHDFVGAYKSLVQYLTDGGGDVSIERRSQVDEMFAKLRGRIADLQITTNVAGADIRIDDVSVGTSPLPGPIAVNVGTRKIGVFKSGSAPAIRMLTVAGRETVKVEINLDESVAGRSAPASSSVAVASASVTARQHTATAPSRTPLVLAVSATAALAIGTVAFGYLALNAQNDLKDQVNTYPNTRDRIEDARTKSKRYGYITDALGAATLVAGAASVYFAVTYREDLAKARHGRVVLAPSVSPGAAGVSLQGQF